MTYNPDSTINNGQGVVRRNSAQPTHGHGIKALGAVAYNMLRAGGQEVLNVS